MKKKFYLGVIPASKPDLTPPLVALEPKPGLREYQEGDRFFVMSWGDGHHVVHEEHPTREIAKRVVREWNRREEWIFAVPEDERL